MLTSPLPALLALCIAPSQAWVSSSHPLIRQHRATTTTSLFSTRPNRGDNKRQQQNKKGKEYDVEAAREALEELMAHNAMARDEMHHPQGPPTHPGQHPHEAPHLITSSGRHRRELEMSLLRQLHVVDTHEEHRESKAVDELMHLWMFEHDSESAEKLEAMQHVCSPGMQVEEEQLREMCDQYPTWAEPRARLAILLFMKGRSEEAYDAALDALDQKPWHFEVYPILIMICLREQDMGGALYWARRALPTYRPNGKNKRRTAWIEHALTAAAEQWEQYERETIEHARFMEHKDDDVPDEDSWQ